MNAAVDEEHLPGSVGGLVELAFAAYVERAPLFLALAVVALVAGWIVEVAVPSAALGTPQAEIKLLIFTSESMVIDSLLIAAVAIGIGTRVAGRTGSSGAIVRAALARWLPVFGVTVITNQVVALTSALSGLASWPEPKVLVLFTAPLVWLLWGALSLAAPIAALSADRPLGAILSGIVRAFALAFQRDNLARLCFLAFISIVPNLVQSIAFDQLAQHHIARVVFWSGIPIDALATGPLAALQTVFALDFARRAGRLENPPSAP